MPVVSAFLVPGSPLPLLRPDNPPWSRLASGYRTAQRSLHMSRPDLILVYSTQWLAVLDELWQARPHLAGTHVDENWYEFGDLDYELRIDTELALACVEAAKQGGFSSKGVDYGGFPVDTGTIVANRFLNPRSDVPLAIAANNLYHGWDETYRIGEIAARTAARLGRRTALVGVGGLSGSIFRDEIDIRNDGIASGDDDRWNRRILSLLQRGDAAGARGAVPDFAREAKADMGFKHFAWILGGLGGRLHGARIHAYGATWGAGAAVIEFKV